jgi:hypothetical protein
MALVLKTSWSAWLVESSDLEILAFFAFLSLLGLLLGLWCAFLLAVDN